MPTEEIVAAENVKMLSFHDEDASSGAFFGSLKRNNAEIRDNRAKSIAEGAQLIYKRAIEDMDLQIKNWKREQENMLDLSPTDANSLILADEFDPEEYVAKDINLRVKIRNTKIKMAEAIEGYKQLFRPAADDGVTLDPV